MKTLTPLIPLARLHCSAGTRARRLARRRRGFTLIEAALTAVIVGTGVLAMVSAQQAYMLNLRPFDPAQPLNVGAESNENGAVNPASDPANVTFWDDVDDFAGVPAGGTFSGVSFQPPVNGMGIPIAEMAQWSQDVRVESVLPTALDVELGEVGFQALGTTDMLRVTCTVFFQRDANSGRETISSLSWVVPR